MIFSCLVFASKIKGSPLIYKEKGWDNLKRKALNFELTSIQFRNIGIRKLTWFTW